MNPGMHVGPYEIQSALGAGGMGEVYRARDTRLDRVVAIKVLPQGVADDPQRRQRFQREARAISSLAHPHICTLYDVGHHEGIDYLVMELLEGQTLEERLRKGSLPLDQALRYAIEIADALGAAHRRGIVHRDLKPANVMLTKAGAKLLDFGIAKAVASQVDRSVRLPPSPEASAFAEASADRHSLGDGSEPHGTVALTAPPTLTAEGTLLGTPQYMSPEQLEGRDADARSDLFAFGAVLYEMLIGRRAFPGESQSKVIAAVLDSEPPPLATTLPPVLDYVVMTCLAKNPDERWQSASDVKRQLEWIAASARSPAATTMAGPGLRGGHTRSMAVVVASLVALIAGGALTWAVWIRRPAPSIMPETRLEISTPPTTQPWSLAISPDGLTIAFVAESQGKPVLWVRPLNAVAARPLAGTSGSTDPFWSPDSQSIGFFADGKLKRIDLKGGAPQTLAEALQPHGGAWSQNRTIIFAPHQISPLLEVSADGGEPSAVTQLGPGQQGHSYPQFLPDGDVLYYVTGATDIRGAYVGRLDGTASRKLLDVSEPARYASTGHVLFVRENALLAQAFDSARLELKEGAFRVADRVAVRVMGGSINMAGVSASNTGSILYRGTGTAGGRQLTWFDRAGKALTLVGNPDPARISNQGVMSVSPDDRRVSLARTVDGNLDLWLLDLERSGAMSRFTFDRASDGFPLWSRDGLRLAFGSTRRGELDLFQRLVGGNSDEPLLVTSHNKVPVDWSPDGRVLLYLDADPKTHLDIWALPIGREEKPFPVVQSDYEDLNPQFSPDGTWIAYQSNESNRYEVYVRRFRGAGTSVPISTDGGTQPRWRRDGKELFYLGLDQRLTAVPIAFSSDGRSVKVGTQSPLFQTRIGGPGISQREYEVSRDGQRFLMDAPVDEPLAPIVLIQNWKP